MMRAWVCLAAVAALSACGQGGNPPVPVVEPDAPSDAFPALEDDAFSQGVMTLRFYDDAPTTAMGELPRFELASSRCRYEEGDVWTFEDADAVIRSDDESEMRIEAGHGRVDHRTKHAIMEGGVRLTTGDLTIELEDLTWSNAERVASSEKPLRIVQGGTDLSASAMQLYPDESRVVLHEARGRIVRPAMPAAIAEPAAVTPETETPPA